MQTIESQKNLQQVIKDVLTNYSRRDLCGTGKPAAILFPLFWKRGVCHVLLTKRTTKVEHHKGEISFPGGRQDREDSSLLCTALRETQEEIGLPASQIDILGALDDSKTRVSDFIITPFVGWIPYPYEFSLSQLEIEKILEIPLEFFLTKENYCNRYLHYQGETFLAHFYQWQPQIVIWGATARIILGFCRLLQANFPVGHELLSIS